MAKILFLMDDTTHIDKTELLNKKYNTNGISDFLNKEFERQKAENNSLVEVIDADFLEVLHNNYEIMKQTVSIQKDFQRESLVLMLILPKILMIFMTGRINFCMILQKRIQM